MKFLLISPKNRTVYNFRGELLRAIISKGYEVIVTGPDKTDIDRIEELGARFVEMPMNKTGTSILADLQYCKHLKTLMQEEKPDVTLGYTSKPVIYGAIAAHAAGVKNINCMITGGGYTFTAKTLKARVLGIVVRNLYRIALAKAHHVIFQNRDDLNEFTEKHIVKAAKCSIVNGSGVNTQHFQPAAYPAQVSFFMLSRLLKSKGVAEYLEAAKIVKATHPEAKFYLLGKYEHDMQDALPQAYVGPFIRDGIVERFEETNVVRLFYALAWVFFLPSYREGTPRTVLEAMAMARPIITTDTNGCRDTVQNGVTGFLVPVKDAAAVAEKMLWFIEHPEEVPQMGNAARELCKAKFDVLSVNQNMLKYMGIEG